MPPDRLLISSAVDIEAAESVSLDPSANLTLHSRRIFLGVGGVPDLGRRSGEASLVLTYVYVKTELLVLLGMVPYLVIYLL